MRKVKVKEFDNSNQLYLFDLSKIEQAERTFGLSADNTSIYQPESNEDSMHGKEEPNLN